MGGPEGSAVCQQRKPHHANNGKAALLPPPAQRQLLGKRERRLDESMGVGRRGQHSDLVSPEVGYINIQDEEEDMPGLFSTDKVTSRKSARVSNDDKSQSLKILLNDFCNRTSSHGVPFFRGESYFGRLTWMGIFVCCLSVFCFQTYLTMKEYFQYRTSIEMQLMFSAAPFPAVTICNLNAFKYSELIKFPEFKQGFKIWMDAIKRSERNEQQKRRKALIDKGLLPKESEADESAKEQPDDDDDDDVPALHQKS